MQRYKKHIMIGLLVLFVIVGTSATTSTNEKFKNLKVLPKDISSKELNKIMIDEFEDGLGVGCNFCHAEDKNTQQLDYASDAKPEKEIARAMMRMTLNINKEYFQVKKPVINDSVLVVTCTTCHNGQPHPASMGAN